MLVCEHARMSAAGYFFHFCTQNSKLKIQNCLIGSTFKTLSIAMKQIQNQDKISKIFSEKLRAVHGIDVVAVYWFGSRAIGEGKPDSDYDFMVETKSKLTERQRDAVADIAVDIAADYGVLLDIHYYTSKDIVNPPYSRSPFIMSVLEEGIRI